MTTANQKATRTYNIVNGGSREALFLQLQLVGRTDIAQPKPFVFEVDNNLTTFTGGHRCVVPGRVEVYVDGIDFLRDIYGRRDGEVVEVRGEIAKDSSFSGDKGRFRAVYDLRHRGRKTSQKFHQNVNTIELYVR